MLSSSFPHGLYAMESGPMKAAFSGNSTILTEAYDRGKPVQYGQPVNPDIQTDPVNADLIHVLFVHMLLVIFIDIQFQLLWIFDVTSSSVVLVFLSM